jgi:two-component system, NarL family, sensor kinase
MRKITFLLICFFQILLAHSHIKADSLKLKLNNMKEQGNNFVISGQYTKAIKIYFEALKLAELRKDTLSIATIYNNIAVSYRELAEYDNSLEFSRKAEILIPRINNNAMIADIFNTFGNVYFDTYKDSMAIEYFLKSHTYRILAGDSFKLATSFKNLAAFYFEKGEFNKGFGCINNSIKIREKLNDSSGIASSYLAIGEMFLNQNGKEDSSLLYLNKGYKYIQLNTSIYTKKEFYESFVILYSVIKDFENAFRFQKILVHVKDSILSIEKTKQLVEMQTKYETEKKEQQLKLNSVEIDKQKYRNNVQILLFAIFVLLIIILSGFIFYRNKQRQKAEHNHQEKLRFKAVIDSEEKERIRIAKELHDGLGQLLSSAKLNMSSLEDGVPKEDEYLLKNSLTIIDDAVKEVRNISHNMMPTALMNYGLIEATSALVKKINDSRQISVNFVKDNFSLTLEKETEIAIYRIIQEIFNNMIKHSKADQIDILFSNNDRNFLLQIKDNGIGFDTSLIKNSQGIGWQNIYSRVSMLNGTISVDSQTGKGTEIKIQMTI